MSTQPITSSSYSTGYSLSSLGNNNQLQVTGLASGLDTNEIIQALTANDQQSITNLTNEQSGLSATNTQLTSIQTALQQLVTNAQALSDPTLFANSQTVSSTDSTLVSATTTGDAGAVVGGYQISVTALASAATKTFTFNSPSQADTVTIDGTPISLAAGASAQDLANAVNSSSADVWATVTNTDSKTGQSTIVFSSRNTGTLSGNWMSISDSQNALADTGNDVNGTDAAYTIGKNSYTSPSDTVTNAIPGVTLTFNGTTETSGSVGVTVSPPGPSTQNIQTAVQAFVTSYNSVVSQIQTQLSTAPQSGQPTVGTLYDDPELQDLLTDMRQAMDATQTGLASGSTITSMLSIGVSTGAASGDAAPSQSSIDGDLTLDTSALSSAVQSDPNGVLQMLQSWSQNFNSIVNAQAAPGGAITQRISDDTQQSDDLANQISGMQQNLADKQASLQQEFADMEAALSANQSTSSWLTSQLDSLPTP